MKLGIYGSGGLGKEIKKMALSLNKWDEIIFINDYVPEGIFKDSKIMPFDKFKEIYSPKDVEVVVGVGNPRDRKLLYERFKEHKYSFANIIHPQAYVCDDCKLGEGVIIAGNAYVGSESIIGDNSFISSNVFIAYSGLLHGHNTILQSSILGGGSEIGDSTFIGQGSIIRERTKIGNNAVVAMGSVSFSDVPDDVVIMGNPARIIGKNDGKELFK